MNLGENLKNCRLKRKLTQKKVEQLTNINYKTLSNWENNVSNPSPADLMQLSAAYNVSVDCLLGQELPSKPEKTKESRASYGEDRQTERDCLFDAYQNAPENVQKSIKLLLDPFVPKHLFNWISGSKK